MMRQRTSPMWTVRLEASSRDTAISDAIAGDNARGLVQLAVTENVANLSEYYLSYEEWTG